MAHFHKYPRIPHVPGSRGTSDDVYTAMPEGDFHVYEKLDGACVGITMDKETKTLRMMNRGGWIDEKRPHEQWGALKAWVYENYEKWYYLFHHVLVAPDVIVFGEWLWAEHSVHYNELPDYFIAFDVWNPINGFSVHHPGLYMELAGLTATPKIGETSNIQEWLAHTSHEPLYADSFEGYIFREALNYGQAYKYVLPSFQVGKEHWFDKKVVRNELSQSS